MIAVEVLRHHLGAEEKIGRFRCWLIDIITGNAGTNSLTGSVFNDTIIGGGGLDTLAGGLGDDLYLITKRVDHSAAEIADAGGNDELRFASTTAAQILSVFAGDTGLERVVIGTGSAAGADTSGTTTLGINALAAPNALTITGNAGSNVITGTAFTDTIDGGLGNDLYLVASSLHHSAAEFSDAGGSDELRFASTTAGQTLTVFSGDVGLDSVTIGTGTAAAAVITATTALHVNANAAANGLRIKGNNGANTLIGSGFDDLLNGAAGNDTLIGGAGADTYRFDSTLNSTTNKDLLIDFSPSQNDRIELENAVFTGFATTGPLSATAFAVSAAATTPSACILYNNSTGTLTYDSNGTLAGGTTVLAVLPSGLGALMTASLFTVT